MKCPYRKELKRKYEQDIHSLSSRVTYEREEFLDCLKEECGAWVGTCSYLALREPVILSETIIPKRPLSK